EAGVTGNPGNAVKFVVGQEVPVNPSDTDNNGVELNYVDGVPLLQLATLTAGTPQRGNIYVNELSALPDQGCGMIGLAIGGSPAYAAPAARNRLEVFTPHPNYWITAGNFEVGVALGTGTIIVADGNYGILTCAHNVYDATTADHLPRYTVFAPALTSGRLSRAAIAVRPPAIRFPADYGGNATGPKDYAVIRLTPD